ncbi:hypothetical protein DNTS_031405 [Danionella cerebrum]|uniref:Proline-rich transmembrane protein 3/4 domain-containing protein n=1 Tax=Danionella cerebrum TaxID=2873325 RepID=A0A553RAL6_9TELE|nr:hypothetical protein DNTS_031405 [Danionella translucida]
MARLLALLLGLSLLQQTVTSLESNLTKTLTHNNVSIHTGDGLLKTQPTSFRPSFIEDSIKNPLFRDLLLPLLPTSTLDEGSGEGSGYQQSLEVVMPSTSALEMHMFVPERAEKQDLEKQEFGAHPALPTPQKLTQHINDDDDQDIILESNTNAPKQVTVTMAAESSTKAHRNGDERRNKEQGMLTAASRVRETNPTEIIPVQDEDAIIAGETKTSEDTKNIPLINLSSNTKSQSHDVTFVVQSSTIQESFDGVTLAEEHGTHHPPATAPSTQPGMEKDNKTTSDLPLQSSSISSQARDDTRNEEDKRPRWYERFFGPLTEKNLSVVMKTCILGPCVVSTSENVTQLQWDDLKRTLAFAWEIHVFGSAGLFLLVVVAAILGTISATNMRHPYCEVFTLANILVLLEGLLRFVQLIIDPYGTRNILSRPTLTALYNLPVPLLLWAQATLALLALREETSPRRLSVTGALAALHCTSLLVSDLLSKTLSPALPLMLQTFTICWGLPLCLGIFFHSLKKLCSAPRTSLPRWSAPKRIEKSVRSVLLLSAFLGTLSCALHTYSFLWLYGLLGDWRRFGWGWWLGQLSARLLELAWSFCLLLLGSRVFWKPQSGKQTANRKKTGKPASSWNKLFGRLPMGPWTRQDKNWAKLLPNNWKSYKQSGSSVSQSVIQSNPSPATSIKTVLDNPSAGGVVYNSRYDQQGSQWNNRVEWREQECVLSLVEFDLNPPSPINLHHSIDSALHHAHVLGVGTIFTPSAHTRTQSAGFSGPFYDDVVSCPTPVNKAYQWALDAASGSNSSQHLGTAVKQTQVSVIEPIVSLTPENIRRIWEKDRAIPRVNMDEYTSVTSEDDMTSL